MSRARTVVRWFGDRPTVLIVIFFFGVAMANSYSGRQQLVDSQRHNCHSGLPITFSDMESWYGAHLARLADAAAKHEGVDGVDRQAASTYLSDVTAKMTRVDRVHSLVWPDPRNRGAHGPYTHPLGYGHFSCESAYPNAPLITLNGL